MHLFIPLYFQVVGRIETTMIYARIADEVLREAASRLPEQRAKATEKMNGKAQVRVLNGGGMSIVKLRTIRIVLHLVHRLSILAGKFHKVFLPPCPLSFL